MIENVSEGNERVPIRDKIRMGCESIGAYCLNCKKNIYAWLLDGKALCPICQGQQVTIKANAQKKPSALPFFYVPGDCRSIVGEKPTALSIIPAYQTLEQAIPHGFARFCKGIRLPICVGDGKQATIREKEVKKNIPCSSDCPHRQKGYCKITGRFYFYIPEVDVMSAFQMRTSQTSTINIINTLKRLVGKDAKIHRQICTLRLAKGINSVGQPFTYAELLPPTIPLSKLQEMGVESLNSIGGVIHYLPYSNTEK